ncbi:hypothetical protein HYU15_00890 [Candidatus Woesearchaeota archaeon]|nr:hypothetical protein [Candidatus Woesearchaeota archaeon]
MDDETDYKSMSISSLALALFLWVPLLNVLLGALAAWLGTKAILHVRRKNLGYGNRYAAFAAIGTIAGAATTIFSVVDYFWPLYSHI